MKDIPLFTTENGVASLTLREIPYRQTAYVRVQSSQSSDDFLKECRDFCVAVGAERIYVSADFGMQNYPLHTTVIKMTVSKDQLPSTDAALFPVQENTAQQWLEIYNRRMQNVSHSKHLTMPDLGVLIRAGEAYFVHSGEQLLGIGVISSDCVNAIITEIPGEGERVLLALCQGIFADTISLEVASDNISAIKLYQRLGFLGVSEVQRWYILK